MSWVEDTGEQVDFSNQAVTVKMHLTCGFGSALTGICQTWYDVTVFMYPGVHRL